VLRRVLYGLGRKTLQEARIAFSGQGALLVHAAGAEAIPVGTFLRELRDGLFIPAGFDPVPSIAPDVLFQALGSPANAMIVMLPDRPAMGFPRAALVPLESALIEGHAWAAVDPVELESSLQAEIPRVEFDPLGMRPMSGVGSAPEKG